MHQFCSFRTDRLKRGFIGCIPSFIMV
uniref:Uncharacterized protein n=1 Tax=Rhizophora mucronata TaxID=61149 RepID=A0A2P2J2T0_RHIMU